MPVVTPSPRIVIVGASLAGLRTAEAIKAALPEARIVLVGRETHRPYNRPPLSKDAIAALAASPADIKDVFGKLLLRSKLTPQDAELRLGCVATGMREGQLILADGSRINADWIVAASGLSPRRLPLTGAQDRRYVLRSFEDAQRLALALRRSARMVVIGGGFIGCEIAATARSLGLHVDLVETEPQPMLRALGSRVAAAMAAWHRRHGVRIHAGRTVSDFAADHVVLDDGDRLEADVIVEALGALPNVGWLEGSGADLSDGVLTDDRMGSRPCSRWAMSRDSPIRSLMACRAGPNIGASPARPHAAPPRRSAPSRPAGSHRQALPRCRVSGAISMVCVCNPMVPRFWPTVRA